MRTIDTSVTIAAPPSLVWDLLMDFPAYPEWNPFVISAEGRPAVDTTLTVQIKPAGGTARTMRPTVIAAEPGKLLRWRGTLPIPGLLTAEHEFAVLPQDDATLFRHRETFRGLLLPLLTSTLRRTEEGFHAMNQALKQRAEHASSTQPS